MTVTTVTIPVVATPVPSLLGRVLGLAMGLQRFGITDSWGHTYVLSNIGRVYQPTFNKLVLDAQAVTGVYLRRFIANKRLFKFSWTMLPFPDASVTDGGIGVQSIKQIFNTDGVMTLYVPDLPDGTVSAYSTFCSLDSFSLTNMQFVNDTMYCDVTVQFEER